MKRTFKKILLLQILVIVCTCLYSQGTDSVTFIDLYKLALENNYSLIIARNSAEAAKISNSIGNAGFLPALDASANAGNSVVNSSQEFYDGRTRDAQGAKSNSVNALVEINWTIFDGTKMFISKQKLNELEKQGEIELRIRTEEIYMQLAAYYYDLIQELKYKDVLENSLITNRDRLMLANKKYVLGSASESDLIQARLDLNADSNAVIKQSVVIENMKADINHLIGREPSIDFIPADKIIAAEIPGYDQLLADANQQNQDMILARSNEQVSQITMRESFSKFLPVVSLYSDYSYAASESQTGLLTSNKSYGPAYGIRFSYNLFNGFIDKQQYQVNRINYENAQAQTNEMLNSIQTELLKSYNNYTSSIQVLNIERANIADAEKNLQLAIELYKHGQISEIDFRSYQQKTIEAESQLLSAEYAVRMAELNLLRLSGQLKIQ
jgi:outer membrane protein